MCPGSSGLVPEPPKVILCGAGALLAYSFFEARFYVCFCFEDRRDICVYRHVYRHVCVDMCIDMCIDMCV